MPKVNIALTSQATTPLYNSQQTPPPSTNRTYANITYAGATRGKNEINQDMTSSTFLEEFKQMFNQLVQQNGIVLNMLTKLLSKI
jgi:hypothetical protein